MLRITASLTLLLVSLSALAESPNLNDVEAQLARAKLGEARSSLEALRGAATDWINYTDTVFSGDDGRYLTNSSYADQAVQLTEELPRELPTAELEGIEGEILKMEAAVGVPAAVAAPKKKKSKLSKLRELYGESEPEVQEKKEGVDTNKQPFPQIEKIVEVLNATTQEYSDAKGLLAEMVKSAKASGVAPSDTTFDEAYAERLQATRAEEEKIRREHQEKLEAIRLENELKQNKIRQEQERQRLARETEEEQRRLAEEERRARQRAEQEEIEREKRHRYEQLVARATNPATVAKWSVFLQLHHLKVKYGLRQKYPVPGSWKFISRVMQNGPEALAVCLTGGRPCGNNPRPKWGPMNAAEKQEAFEELSILGPIWVQQGMLRP